MQKHENCGAFGSVDKIICHIINCELSETKFSPLVRSLLADSLSSHQYSHLAYHINNISCDCCSGNYMNDHFDKNKKIIELLLCFAISYRHKYHQRRLVKSSLFSGLFF